MFSARFFLTLTLFLAGVGCRTVTPRPSEWAQPVAATPVENLYEVEPGLYRGSIAAAEDGPLLQRLGITQVVCLCNSKPGTFHGIQKICVPMSPAGVTDDEIITAVRALRDRQGPTLVHCQRGADRTGCVVAMYRVLVRNWSRDEAAREMVHGGFRFYPGWRDLVQTVRHADTARLRAALGPKPATPHS